MVKLTIRNITAHKRRLLATCLAVILGVAFLTATLVLGDTMRAGFRTQIAQGIGDTAVAVRSTTRLSADDQTGQTGLVDASLVDQLRTVDGVADAEPSVEGAAQLVGHDRTPIGGDGPPTVGVNWIPTGPLNAFHIVDGRAPAAAGEVAIDRRSADLGSLHVGDQTVVRAPDPVPVTVVGIVAFGDQDTLGGATVTFFTTEQASELLLGQPGKSDQRVARRDAGRERRRARRPRPGDAARPAPKRSPGRRCAPSSSTPIDTGFLDFFRALLLAFAAVALLVATFSIYNTLSIVVAQRTRESALLRALGASRRQVLRSVDRRGVPRRRDRLGHRPGRRLRHRRRPEGAARRPVPAARRRAAHRRDDHRRARRRHRRHARRQHRPGGEGVARRPARRAARRRRRPQRDLRQAGRRRAGRAPAPAWHCSSPADRWPSSASARSSP